MRTALLAAVILGCSMASSVRADGIPADFWFTYNAPGGTAEIPEGSVGVYPLFMNNALNPGSHPHIDFIDAMELEIEGLSHVSPMDLDIYLIDPFGNTIEIMTDLGDSNPISGLTLIFNDKSADIPPDPIVAGSYLPEGLFNGTDLGMATFVGGPNAGGTDAWILLIIDDAEDGQTGSFSSYTLRGAVPEPMTVSLVAMGALALLRRRRN